MWIFRKFTETNFWKTCFNERNINFNQLKLIDFCFPTSFWTIILKASVENFCNNVDRFFYQTVALFYGIFPAAKFPDCSAFVRIYILQKFSVIVKYIPYNIRKSSVTLRNILYNYGNKCYFTKKWRNIPEILLPKNFVN